MTESVKQDPELFEDNEEGAGMEDGYDGVAVETIDYDHSQFELPDDYEYEGDDDE